ncbi:MAG: permease [Lachnospiraceae bacterium]|nr:permease [Lachnospiraceae bacterium]
MRTPVYVVTGYLDAGKTSFIQSVLELKKKRDKKILLLMFEEGEKKIEERVKSKISVFSFGLCELEQNITDVRNEIRTIVLGQQYDEIWAEWNGMASFRLLEELLMEGGGIGGCYIEKVLYVGEIWMLKERLDKTGEIPFSQIVNSDLVVLREEKRIKKPLKSGRTDSVLEMKQRMGMMEKLNPKALLFKEGEKQKIIREIYSKKSITKAISFGIIFLLFSIVLMSKQIWQEDFLLKKGLLNFLGILLQAMPFLILGVLLSSFIQVYVSRAWIQRFFPKQTAAGMLCAVLFGFFLPVCDCTSIPVFKSLVKKEIPLSAAVTFMTVSPVINPVVILSTYYAFGGNMHVVFTRIGCGIVAAVIIGLTFKIKGMDCFLKDAKYLDIWCSCGCYELKDDMKPGIKKLYLFIRHAKTEFFSVFPYLITGILISVIIQILHTEFDVHFEHSGFEVQLFVMMLLSFLFSLCSSSDAIVARSYQSSFSMGALYGFMVLGPMMDIKNMLMLTSGFTRKFVIRLMITCFLVCFAVVWVASKLGAGGGLG